MAIFFCIYVMIFSTEPEPFNISQRAGNTSKKICLNYVYRCGLLKNIIVETELCYYDNISTCQWFFKCFLTPACAFIITNLLKIFTFSFTRYTFRQFLFLLRVFWFSFKFISLLRSRDFFQGIFVTTLFNIGPSFSVSNQLPVTSSYKASFWYAFRWNKKWRLQSFKFKVVNFEPFGAVFYDTRPLFSALICC